jgi:hypothetical protein
VLPDILAIYLNSTLRNICFPGDLFWVQVKVQLDLNDPSLGVGDAARHSLQNQTLRRMEINLVVEHDAKQWFGSSFRVRVLKICGAHRVLNLTVTVEIAVDDFVDIKESRKLRWHNCNRSAWTMR